MKQIEEIINKAAELRSKLIAANIIDIIFQKMVESRHIFSLMDESPFEGVDSKPGIYFFEVKFPFIEKEKLGEFGTSWGLAKAKGLIHDCPRYYKGRVKPNLDALRRGDFVSLYIGKQENIQKRLNSHLNDELSSTTYGLKLKARWKILQGCEFRASWVAFDIPPEAYFCIELLENAIRAKVNPLLGKQ